MIHSGVKLCNSSCVKTMTV